MPDVTKLQTLKLTFKEASHIDYVHEKRHMFVSLETEMLRLWKKTIEFFHDVLQRNVTKVIHKP